MPKKHKMKTTYMLIATEKNSLDLKIRPRKMYKAYQWSLLVKNFNPQNK